VCAFAGCVIPLSEFVDRTIRADLFNIDPNLRIGNGDQSIVSGMRDVEEDLRNFVRKYEPGLRVVRFLEDQF